MFGGTIEFEFDKMFICGQSAGGQTAIMAAEGDQQNFHACLTHDPACLTHIRETRDDKIDMRQPCYLLHGIGFYGSMTRMAFAYDKGFEDYDTLIRNFQKRNTDGKFEAVVIDNCAHSDQGDGIVYNQYFTRL